MSQKLNLGIKICWRQEEEEEENKDIFIALFRNNLLKNHQRVFIFLKKDILLAN